MNPDNFQLITGYKGYVSKAEITALDPRFLVKKSKNVIVDYALRVISRNGYKLYNQANTGAGGCKGSYEWATSTKKFYSMRTNDNVLSFDWNGAYNTLMSNLRSPMLEFTKIWDNTEKIDVLIFVMGDTNCYKWSGGTTYLRSATSSTVTKQGVITAATTIAFVAGTTNVIAPTITDSANNFLNAGFKAGDTLHVIGSAKNSRNFTIGSVTAGTITLIMSDILVSETAGPTITLHTGEPTWAASRFLTTGTRSFLDNGIEYTYTGGENSDTLTGVQAVVGTSLGTATITIANPAVVTRVAHGLVAGDQIVFSTTGALPTGLTAGTRYFVLAAGLTADTFELSATSGGSAIVTTGSQSGVHTLSKINAPTVVLGDPVWQTVVTLANPGSIDADFKQDYVGVELNQLILASSTSYNVYGSATDSYTNFTLPGMRAPGDPVKVTMDNYCTCIIPIDNPSAAQTSTMFGAGINEFFQLSFKLSQDNTNELVRMIKLATADSSGLISAGAITSIRKATAYISREPALDTLDRIENSDRSDMPLSDPIKTDFDTYNFTGAHIKYWKRAIFIALPAEGLVLIYDLMRNLWQPPQTIPVSRLAIINDWLYGHSAITNETYQLFVGTNDNGNFISQRARFAYNNGGHRDRIKNMSAYWSDGYITRNGELNLNVGYGFDGISGLRSYPINGNDPDTVDATSEDGSPDGTEPYGVVPYGGASLGELSGLIGGAAPMFRFWQDDTMDQIDYNEYYVEYAMDTLDGQFAIVAHGSNQWDAGTAPVSHKK
jgi:hypothetical protein